jgi:hypothetical protein
MRVQTIDNVNTVMRSNKLRTFPTRKRGRERLFPFARPNYTLAEPLPENPSFFIAGNCFARGFEKALRKGGFEVMSSAFSSDLPGSAVDQFQRFNNFHADVSANEIAWATGQTKGMNDALIDLGDEWVDMQLHFTMSFPPEEMLRIRAAYNKTYAPIVNADVIVLTVGAANQWYDTQTKFYLNGMPTRKMTDRYPGRFEMHSFDLADAESRIERCVSVARCANPTAQIVLINSPVFQSASFGEQDALIDQTVGKSLQRLAIHNVVSRHERLAYLPVYEVVTLSDYNHSFMPNSPNHTLPDVAVRSAADFLQAGGITDHRQQLIEALGYGEALLRANESEAAEKLLELVATNEVNLTQFKVQRLYLRALQVNGKNSEIAAHSRLLISQYLAFGPEVATENMDELDFDLAEQNQSPFAALFKTIGRTIVQTGDQDQIDVVNLVGHQTGLPTIEQIVQETAHQKQTSPTVKSLLELINKKDNDAVLALVETLDKDRTTLSEAEISMIDTAHIQAAMRAKFGKTAIARMLSFIQAGEVPSASVLKVLGNSARSNATTEQMTEILASQVFTGISDDLRARLQERHTYLVKRNKARKL